MDFRFPGSRVALAVALSGMLLSGCKQLGYMSDSVAGKEPGEERGFAIGHGVELQFRWAPAGSFTMGGHPESGRDQSKMVGIGDGFWIAKDETSAATWQQVMGRESPMRGTSPKDPVAQVSWDDCRIFLKRLKAPAPGWKYELPTESQWEYARRAGSNTGEARKPSRLSWINVATSGGNHPVGMKPANGWSIRDMHGNIAEWCRDTLDGKGAGQPTRGDSRVGTRKSDAPFLRLNHVGFRLVLIREEPKDPNQIAAIDLTAR